MSEHAGWACSVPGLTQPRHFQGSLLPGGQARSDSCPPRTWSPSGRSSAPAAGGAPSGPDHKLSRFRRLCGPGTLIFRASHFSAQQAPFQPSALRPDVTPSERTPQLPSVYVTLLILMALTIVHDALVLGLLANILSFSSECKLPRAQTVCLVYTVSPVLAWHSA